MESSEGDVNRSLYCYLRVARIWTWPNRYAGAQALINVWLSAREQIVGVSWALAWGGRGSVRRVRDRAIVVSDPDEVRESLRHGDGIDVVINS